MAFPVVISIHVGKNQMGVIDNGKVEVFRMGPNGKTQFFEVYHAHQGEKTKSGLVFSIYAPDVQLPIYTGANQSSQTAQTAEG